MMNLRLTTALVTSLVVVAGTARAQPAPERPNILWLTCEDISPHVGAFGDTYAVTPNIDRLAAQGVRYVNAFSAIGVCAPSRSSIIMGLYAPSAGTQHMRSSIALPPSVKLYSRLLRDAGYYATNHTKRDYNLVDEPKDAWDDTSTTAHWKNRKQPKQPFFSIFNFGSSHESGIRLAEGEYNKRVAGFAAHERHDPALARIPPYHPDVPEVRRDWARYADAITYMDKEVGAALSELDQAGLADSTIVFFYSDHGAGMPRSKRWLYDSSTRVPLIVRFGKKYQHLAPGPAGSVSDRMVSLIDTGPTALSLAGAPVPPTMHGKPFAGTQAQATPPPQYVYGFRDRMDERYDMLRTVRDRRFRYIRNYLPHRPYAQHLSYMYQMPTMQAWQRLFDEGKLLGPQRLFFLPKPSEELYDTWADPHEVHNLAGELDFRPLLDRMREALDRWLLEIHDTGFLPEAEMHARAVGSTPYDLARDPARYDLERIMEIAGVASRREAKNLPRLRTWLADRDSAVRYWAATGLAALGDKARSAEAALVKATRDASPNVRIAAAEALLGLGRARDGLAVLRAALGEKSAYVRLHALNVITILGDKAKPLLPELKKAVPEGGSEDYVWRVITGLIERLQE